MRAKLGHQEKQTRDAARAAAKAELLLQEESGFLEAEGLEKTFKFRQDQIFSNLDVNSASKVKKEKYFFLSFFFSLNFFFY